MSYFSNLSFYRNRKSNVTSRTNRRKLQKRPISSIEALEDRTLLSGLSLLGTTFSGGAGDQRGSDVEIQNKDIYISVQTNEIQSANASSSLLKYSAPTGPGTTPVFSKPWTLGVLNGISVLGNSVYGAGFSHPGNGLTNDGTGGTEVKTLLSSFDANNVTGAGPSGSQWAAVIPQGTFNSSPGTSFFSYNGVENYIDAIAVEDGGSTSIYAVGHAQPCSHNTFVVGKYDSAGNVIAGATAASADFNTCSVPEDSKGAAFGVIELNGDIYVAGGVRDNFSGVGGRPTLWKYDSNLDVKWKNQDRSIQGSFSATESDGTSLYAVGSAGVDVDFFVAKYDQAGNQLWSAKSGGSGTTEVLEDVAVVNGRLFAVGYTDDSGAGGTDMVILEIDPANGDLLSETLFGGSQDDRARGIATDGNDLYVVGESRSFVTPQGNSIGQNEAVLLRYGINDAPVARDDFFSIDENGTLVVSATNGVLANDTDRDDDTLSVSRIVSAPADGLLTLNADGSLRYSPDAEFFGEDSFTYEISDGEGGNSTATALIEVRQLQSDISIGDRVWFDLNHDGLQNPNEPGPTGVTVELYDILNRFVTSTSTGTDGYYSFSSDQLQAGNYSIRVIPPRGVGFTRPDLGNDDSLDSDAEPSSARTPFFAVTAGQTRTDIDVGLVTNQLWVPILTGPRGRIDDNTPTIRWDAVNAANSYELLVYNIHRGQQVIHETGIVSPSFTFGTPLENARYQVFLRARDEAGSTAWTVPMEFEVFVVGTSPRMPQLISPDRVTDDSTPTIDWKDDGNTDQFELLVYDVNLGQQAIHEDFLAISEFTPTQPLVDSRYQAFVRGLNSFGKSEWSTPLFFDIHTDSPAPNIPDFIGPIGTIEDNTPTVNWTTEANTDTYELLVYNVDLGREVIHESSLQNPTFTQPSSLSDASYKAYVRAENQNGQSAWSIPLVFEIHTKTPPPPAPVITSPAKVTADNTPTINWTREANTDTYELLVYNIDLGREVIHESSLQNPTFTQPSSLSDASYQAYVRAENQNGQSAWSSPLVFVIQTNAPPPPVPTITSPIGSIDDTTPTINWTTESNTDTYELLVYNIELGREAIHERSLQNPTFTQPDSLPDSRYQAYVRGTNQAGQSGWSDPVYFQIGDIENVLAFKGPANATADRTPEISWTEIEGASRYELLVYSKQAGQLVIHEQSLAVTNFTPSEPLADPDLFQAFVRSYDASGTAGEWSDPLEFSVFDISLSASSGSPGQTLTISANSLNPDLTTSVVFTDENGNEMPVPASEVSSTSVEVTVPPFLDLENFDFRAGSMAVSLVQETSAGELTSVQAGGFQIDDLPQTGQNPGAITQAALTQLASFADTAIQNWQSVENASDGTVNTSGLRSDLQTLRNTLQVQQTEIQSLIDGQTESIHLGQISGRDVVLDLESLRLLDRMFVGYFLNGVEVPEPDPRALSAAPDCPDLITCFKSEFLPDSYRDLTIDQMFDKLSDFRSKSSTVVTVATVAAVGLFGVPISAAAGAAGTAGALIYLGTVVVPGIVEIGSIATSDSFVYPDGTPRSPNLEDLQPALDRIKKPSIDYVTNYFKGKFIDGVLADVGADKALQDTVGVFLDVVGKIADKSLNHHDPNTPVSQALDHFTATQPPDDPPSCEVCKFDGTYTGGYSGTAVVPGFGNFPTSGPVTVVVSNAGITVTVPGGGQGSIDTTGSANFSGAGGFGVVGEASYTFSGTFDAISGAASGSWNASFSGGTASGGWSISRNGLIVEEVSTSASNRMMTLTDDDLAPIVDEAIERFEAAGLDEASLEKLRDTHYEVTDLPSSFVGFATADEISIDIDAAGFGWFIDSTPAMSEEFESSSSNSTFVASIDTRAENRFDLLTVIMHEMGHVLGIDHADDESDLMAPSLDPGVRKLPNFGDLDQVFENESLDSLFENIF